jgi:hydrogenase maturation protease
MTFTAKAGTGYGCTEAPRGLLWHRYDMDDEGRVCKAIIVPPTSQNQTRIEEDIANSLTNFGLDKPKDALQLHAEKVIRNYDPCISCATHFLDFSLLRKDSNAAVSTQHRATSFADADMSKTAIIGIGSPQQDDDTGWSIIDSLSRYASIRSLQKKGLSLLKLDRPGINLAEHIKPYDHVLIVDAMREGVDASDFVIIDAPASTTQQANLSSHDAGVLETLQLMDALELSPAQLVIIGVRNDSSEVLDTINKLFRHP